MKYTICVYVIVEYKGNMTIYSLLLFIHISHDNEPQSHLHTFRLSLSAHPRRLKLLEATKKSIKHNIQVK